jgi:metallo-beta-lactamase family protein
VRLQFLGATETVTGSKFHLTNGSHSWLIECGLFQGLKELRRRNWTALPVDIEKLDAVILTHAHIDHSGYVPILSKLGYKGPVFASEPTVELCKILLPDAGFIQEEDAKFAAKKGFSKHARPMPLYTYADAVQSLSQLEAIPDDEEVELSSKVTMRFWPAGHILGSRFVDLEVRDNPSHHYHILFAGDVGGYDSLIAVDPTTIHEMEYLVLESTYGDRLHEDENVVDRFKSIIDDTVKRGGKVVIPSFAVGRTQEVLYILKKLENAGELPDIPVYLNSPLAIDATAIYIHYANEHNFFNNGAPSDEAFRPSRLEMVYDADGSKELNRLKEPAIIVSSSGMMTGGRILHHLKAYLPDPKSTLVIVGYQAEGTRGRAILDGAKAIKIHGLPVRVAAKVEFIESLSAHADYADLMRWLAGFTKPPRTTFLVHGEKDAAHALKERIISEFGWKVEIPKYLQKYEL